MDLLTLVRFAGSSRAAIVSLLKDVERDVLFAGTVLSMPRISDIQVSESLIEGIDNLAGHFLCNGTLLSPEVCATPQGNDSEEDLPSKNRKLGLEPQHTSKAFWIASNCLYLTMSRTPDVMRRASGIISRLITELGVGARWTATWRSCEILLNNSAVSMGPKSTASAGTVLLTSAIVFLESACIIFSI